MATRRYPTPQQVARAGELFVAAELNRRGAVATLYLTNTPRADVVAWLPDLSRTVNVQVKAKGPNSTVWQGNIEGIREASESAGPDDFIIFVDLKTRHGRPEYYICRYREFAERRVQRHKVWLTNRNMNWEDRESTHASIRISDVKEGKECWGILGVLPELTR